MISPHFTHSEWFHFFREQCYLCSFFSVRKLYLQLLKIFIVWAAKSESFREFPRHLLLFRLKIKWLSEKNQEKLSCYWHITRIKCFTNICLSWANTNHITNSSMKFFHSMNTRGEREEGPWLRALHLLYLCTKWRHPHHIHRHSECIRPGITFFFFDFVVTLVFPIR